MHTIPLNLREANENADLFAVQMLRKARENCPADRIYEIDNAERLFLYEAPTLADRTRSSIEITLSTKLDSLVTKRFSIMRR